MIIGIHGDDNHGRFMAVMNRNDDNNDNDDHTDDDDDDDDGDDDDDDDDNTTKHKILSKTINIAVRCTYYIFCRRNKPWTNPNLLDY